MPCIFVISMVTSTSMQTRLRDVADFSPCFDVIFMPCKLDATERSMHILRYFSKGVLNMWLWSILGGTFEFVLDRVAYWA